MSRGSAPVARPRQLQRFVLPKLGGPISCFLRSAPRFENILDVRSHPIASLSTWDPGHEELVIAGIAVTHRGDDGERHGVGVERSAGRTPADASASPRSGMGRDHPGPLGWTVREEPNDFFGQRVREGFVLNRSVFGFAQAAPSPRLFVHQTGSFGLDERLFLCKNPLALVATP